MEYIEDLEFWSEDHSISFEIAEAIDLLANSDIKIMNRMVTQPTDTEIYEVWEIVTQGGLIDDSQFYWGTDSLHRKHLNLVIRQASKRVSQ